MSATRRPRASMPRLESRTSSSRRSWPTSSVTHSRASETTRFQRFSKSCTPTSWLAGRSSTFKGSAAPDVDETKIFGSFYNKGDVEFNNEQHHGTKKERLDAFLAGFEIEEDDVNVAFDRGDVYVRNLRIRDAREYFARNLSVYYVAVGSPDGTFGLKVTRPPRSRLARRPRRDRGWRRDRLARRTADSNSR